MLTTVMPNYNHARFLPEALDSVIAQTRPADEIIVIDDASTDDSVAVIERHVARHPNLRLIRNEKNLGVVRNVNIALGLARGTFVHFAAADDVMYPQLYATALDLLGEFPEAALFSARCSIIDAAGNPVAPLPSPVPRWAPGYLDRAAVVHQLLRDDGWFAGGSTVWRRDALRAVGGFPEELGSFADGYVSRLLALKHGACFSPEFLCAWRRMEGGMAWSSTVDENATARLIEAATRRFAEAGVFPSGYAEAWSRRHLFGVRRFALVQARRAAWSRGTLEGLAATAKEVALTAWLFARFRRTDLAAIVSRRIGLGLQGRRG